ncbi:RICIN domain-containing protein [Streptomyces sp. NPDC002888]|uniref:RICIN domain-containing protein n=1 Tax=Streptomyces sp. NPDC002888 TaxID=3364668 RepID=UPI0036C337EF
MRPAQPPESRQPKERYATGTAPSRGTTPARRRGGYYRLVARHSGKCLDVADASTANGARLIQWPCGTGANQQMQRPAV